MCRLTPFGVWEGREVPCIELSDGEYAVELLPYGAAVRAIYVPDRNGDRRDICLGYDRLEEYRDRDACFGGTIGRCANRIGGARFTIDGREYRVTANEGENCLHGGNEGFHRRLWDFVCTEDAVTFSYTSPDGEEGFPGTVHAEVTYRLTGGELSIEYRARTDRSTVVNLTNHAYFNLDGHDAGTVENLTLQINADCVTEADPALIPTGRLLPQKGLAYDFTEEVRLGDVLARTPVDPVMRDAGGVDFNYCAGRDRETKLIATLRSPKTGRRMDVITDQPGVQCYTGQGLDHTGKGGVHYGPYAGVCLETQHYPDAIHRPHFESYVLRPQDKYDTFTIFRFTAE